MNTQGKVFQPEDMAILGNIAKCSFISSAFPAEVKPVSDPSYESWARTHEHAHQAREVQIVLSGTGHQLHCGKIYPVRPGVLLLYDAMEQHADSYPDDYPLGRQLYVTLFRGGCRFNYLSVGGDEKTVRYWGIWGQEYSYQDLGFAAEKWLWPTVDRDVPVEQVRQLCVLALQLLVASVLVQDCQPRQTVRGEPFQQHVVKSMVRYIEQQNGRKCSLETLAHIAGYSKGHFSQLFKEHTGLSVLQYVDNVRVHALQRMLSKRLPLKLIARELGFAHESSLCRWRRKMKL